MGRFSKLFKNQKWVGPKDRLVIKAIKEACNILSPYVGKLADNATFDKGLHSRLETLQKKLDELKEYCDKL